MKKYFIAKSIKGKEYLYLMSSAIFVPQAKRKAIVDILNQKKYSLNNESEIWHIYENDFFTNEQIFKEIKTRKGDLIVYKI